MNLFTMDSYKGFKFRHSLNTGGKAGKGSNKTRSIHVTSLMHGRYFSYSLEDPNGWAKAVVKAKNWVDKIRDNEREEVHKS